MKTFKQYLAEVPLPPEWEADSFTPQKSFASQLRYAMERAAKIGTGSSRVAFVIDYKGRETVLKIAKNVKGLAQNSREADYGLYRMYPEITVPLIDYDEVNEEPRWIHFEKADKLTKAKFKQLTGIGFDDFGNMLEDAESYREGTTDYNMREGITPEEQDRIEDSEIFQQVTDLMGDFDILAGDLTKTSNWGIYKNEPVIIDLGFSSDVHKQYYT
tara:strand:- start:527 stop:1171 length:645 start_codon:yes stop_codon:yes gene_type:complete